MTNNGADWTALGAAVAGARARLRLSQDALAERAGISARTLIDIEAGARTRYRDTTLYRLEHALGWADGSWQAILNGGQPTPITPPVTATDASNDRMAFVIAHRGELSEHTRRALEAIHDAALEELRNRHHHQDQTASQ